MWHTHLTRLLNAISAANAFRIIVPRFFFTLATAKRIGKGYDAGQTVGQLADRFGTSRSLVYASLSRVGTKRRKARNGTKNVRFFDALTPKSAYWIGLLLADGCLMKRRVSLVLRRDDRRHVEKLREALESTCAVRDIESGNACGITVTSEALSSALRRWCVVERKSLIARVHKDLRDNSHFWRGLIDGDGSVSARWRKGKKAYDGRIRLTGSIHVCNAFRAYVFRAIGYRVRIYPSRAVFSAEISSLEACARLGAILWADLEKSDFLERKYEAYQRLCAHRVRLRPKRIAPKEVLKRRSLNRIDAAQMVLSYSQGLTSGVLALQYGVSSTTIIREVRKAGVIVKRPGRRDEIRLDRRALSL